jgi:hypothetical protein
MTVRKVKSGGNKRRVNFDDRKRSRSTKHDVPLFDKSKRREQQFAFDFLEPIVGDASSKPVRYDPEWDDEIPF